MKNDNNRTSQPDAGQGAGEQRTETYNTYGEGAAQSATQSRAGSADGISSSAGKQGSTLGKSILCIEDEHFISELYVRALKKAGYDVTVIVDGAKALAEAQTNAYDIILLDIMVPTMTGIEVLQKLRDPKLTPQLKAKVIITTNLEQGEEDRAAIEKQADGYIIKAEVTPRQVVDFLSHLNTTSS